MVEVLVRSNDEELARAEEAEAAEVVVDGREAEAGVHEDVGAFRPAEEVRVLVVAVVRGPGLQNKDAS